MHYNPSDTKLHDDGRIKYHHNGEICDVAILADLIGLGSSAVNTEGLVIKTLLQDEKTYYVRASNDFGQSGETIKDAFASIEEALIVLSNKYEITGHLIIDLKGEFELNCWYLPQFTGSGTITFKGNNCTVTWRKYHNSTTAYFTNWSGLSINFTDINFNKNDSTLILFEGGKLNFTNINFGSCNLKFDNCRSTVLERCQGDVNNFSFKAFRSTLTLTSCNFIAEFKYCQLELVNCTFNRAFIVEASSLILRNPRIDFRYFTITAKVINSTIEFLSSWLTFQNPGGDPQQREFIVFQSCNIKDFPSNIDVQGNRTFSNTSIVKLVNCTTPETFNNVSYNFSSHTFVANASAIALINTAILKDLTIIGASIYRDAFSILGDRNYDNSNTNIPAETLQEAIDYLYGLITN